MTKSFLFRFFRWAVLINILTFTLLFTMACSPTWISAIEAFLPALEGAVLAIAAFVAKLENTTLSSDFVKNVQKITGDIQTETQNLGALLKDAMTAASEGVIGQINAVLQGIMTLLNSLLSGANITDEASKSKFGQFIAIAVSIVQSILTVIPVLQAFSAHLNAMSLNVALKLDKATSNKIKSDHEAARAAYHAALNTPTGNAAVNQALAALPQELP